MSTSEQPSSLASVPPLKRRKRLERTEAEVVRSKFSETVRMNAVETELTSDRTMDMSKYFLGVFHHEKSQESEVEIQREISRIKKWWIEWFLQQDEPSQPGIPREYNPEYPCDDLCMRDGTLVPLVMIPSDSDLQIYGCTKHGSLHRCGLPGQCYSRYITKNGDNQCVFSRRNTIWNGTDPSYDDSSAPVATMYINSDIPHTTENLFIDTKSKQDRAELEKKLEKNSTTHVMRGNVGSGKDLDVSGRKRGQYNLSGNKRSRSVVGAREIITSLVRILVCASNERRTCVNILGQRCFQEAHKRCEKKLIEWAKNPSVPLIQIPNTLELTGIFEEAMSPLNRYFLVYELDHCGDMTYRLLGSITCDDAVASPILQAVVERLYNMWKTFETLELRIASQISLINFVVYAVLTLGERDLTFDGKIVWPCESFYEVWFPTPAWQTLLKTFSNLDERFTGASYSTGATLFNDCMSELKRTGRVVKMQADDADFNEEEPEGLN